MSIKFNQTIEYYSLGVLIWFRKLFKLEDDKLIVGKTIGNVVKMKDKDFDVLYLHVRHEYLKRKRNNK